MLLAQWLVFVLVTGALIFISYRPLRQPGSHGFYRFFAWEAILALLVKNLPVWFANPLSWNQILSWSLLMICCAPVILGALLLKRARAAPSGEIPAQRQDEPLFEFEKTTALVTTGIYQYIRHPLYSSLLLLAWGIYFKRPDWAGFILAAAASLFLLATASSEEQENIRYFGPIYREYMQHTRRFIPFLF